MKNNGEEILRRILQLYKAKIRIKIIEFFLKSWHLEPRMFLVECEKCKDNFDILFLLLFIQVIILSRFWIANFAVSLLVILD